VLLYRPANAAAELVSPERRGGTLTASRIDIENGSRVQSAVAEKFKYGSMELVRAGLGHDTDLRAGTLSVFGRIRAPLDVKFTDCIDAKQISAHSAGCDSKLAGPCVFNPIQEKDIFQRPASCDGECEAAAGHSTGAFVRVIDASGIQRNEAVETSAVERQ